MSRLRRWISLACRNIVGQLGALRPPSTMPKCRLMIRSALSNIAHRRRPGRRRRGAPLDEQAVPRGGARSRTSFTDAMTVLIFRISTSFTSDGGPSFQILSFPHRRSRALVRCRRALLVAVPARSDREWRKNMTMKITRWLATLGALALAATSANAASQTADLAIRNVTVVSPERAPPTRARRCSDPQWAHPGRDACRRTYQGGA